MVIAIGVVLLALAAGAAWVSQTFLYGEDPHISLTWEYVGIASAMGALVFVLPPLLKRSQSGLPLLAFILLAGIGMRLFMFGSLPVLEDDYHRYLWDGAQVANGVDPYKYSPAISAPFDEFGNPVPYPEAEDLQVLRDEAELNRDLHYRINYPFIKTIYPPLAQGAFALAHWINPYNLNAWRWVLLFVDLLAFALCLGALRAKGLGSHWVALYWWNPVIILEVFNSGHMDVLMTPFLFGALWAAYSGRRYIGAVALAGAAAIKLWPAILMAAMARPYLKRPVHFIGVSALFGIAALVLLLPQLVHLGDPYQGLTAYSQGWQTHAFIFKLLAEGLGALFSNPDSIARALTGLAVIGTTVWLALRSPKDGSGTALAMLGAAGTLLLLSPTGYPWYLTWIAPFLVFAPRAGFLALLITAPLYYTRFLLDNDGVRYEWIILPVAFGVPLLLILADLVRKRPIYG